MISAKMFLNKFCFILAFVLAVASTQNTHVVIPLDKTITWANKQLYGEFLYINKLSTIQVDFGKVNPNISYIVFQVHSHNYNVTVCNNTCLPDSSEHNTNVGFYSSVKPKIDTFYIQNENTVDLKLYVAVHGYGERDPIPGGCNMEFPVSISPFTVTTLQKDYIYVEASAARNYLDNYCLSLDAVSVQFYRMYMPERNFEADMYFNSIMSMMTLDQILKNGEEIPMSFWKMRRMLSAYPGTGSVYVAVAYDSNTNYYSVYSPAYTYACDPLNNECELLDDLLSRFICSSLLFIGLFVCYFGHRFFKTEMFLFGLISGVIITYILISLMAELDLAELIGASVISGVCFGAIWYTFWWYYGIPVIAVMLPALNLGFLVAAIFYHKLSDGIRLLMDDFNFWSLFIFMMLFIALMLVSVAFASNMLCCAVLGAYTVVYPMDYYFGSNLKYIIINTIRRAIIPEFKWALLSPPFEWRDLLVTLIWVILSVTGLLFQHYHNRGRPPFPPPPRSVTRVMPEPSIYGTLSNNGIRQGYLTPRVEPLRSERTPLLA